jgi:hypothetical protein
VFKLPPPLGKSVETLTPREKVRALHFIIWFPFAVTVVARVYLGVVGGCLVAAILLGLVLARSFPVTAELLSDALIVRWLGLRRVVPFASIRDVRKVTRVPLTGEEHEIIVMDLLDQKRVRVLADVRKYEPPGFPWSPSVDSALFTALRARLDHPVAQSAIALLERAGSDTIHWVRRLIGLPNAAAYRSESVDPDTLWSVLENPVAPPQLRVAAAVALRGTLEESGRERIRVVIDESTSPELRASLAVAIDTGADEDSLARALECGEVQTSD